MSIVKCRGNGDGGSWGLNVMPRLVDPSYDVLSLRPVCTMVGILFVYLVVTILLKSIYLEKMKLLKWFWSDRDITYFEFWVLTGFLGWCLPPAHLPIRPFLVVFTLNWVWIKNFQANRKIHVISFVWTLKNELSKGWISGHYDWARLG